MKRSDENTIIAVSFANSIFHQIIELRHLLKNVASVTHPAKRTSPQRFVLALRKLNF